MAMTLLLSLLVFHSNFASAAVYRVGDARGWSFDSASWLGGKRFKAGDILSMLNLFKKVQFISPLRLFPSYCHVNSTVA